MKGFPWMKFKFTNELGDLTNGKEARMSLRGEKREYTNNCIWFDVKIPLVYFP